MSDSGRQCGSADILFVTGRKLGVGQLFAEAGIVTVEHASWSIPRSWSEIWPAHHQAAAHLWSPCGPSRSSSYPENDERHHTGKV